MQNDDSGSSNLIKNILPLVFHQVTDIYSCKDYKVETVCCAFAVMLSTTGFNSVLLRHELYPEFGLWVE